MLLAAQRGVPFASSPTVSCLPLCASCCPQGNVAVKSIAAHAKGPQAIQPDGHVAYTGVRGMRLVETRDSANGAVTGRMLLSGGRKGV